MKISFIVTSYNHEKFILESLQSIEYQSTQVDELIIADDASTDDTAKIIKIFIACSKIPVIKFIENKVNLGITKNAKQAIKAGTGDILIFQAGDDLSTENRALKTIEYFQNYCQQNVIYSSYSIIDENSVQIKSVPRKGEFKDPLYFIKKGSLIPPYGVALRRAIVDAMPDPPGYLKNEDDFLGMYFIINGGIKICEDSLYKYRVHRSSLSAWYNIDLDFDVYLKLFLDNQENRMNNLRAWNELFINKYINSTFECDSEKLSNLSCLIERKIKIKDHIMHVKSINLHRRIRLVLMNINILNAQECLILILGKYGVKLIRYLRNF